MTRFKSGGRQCEIRAGIHARNQGSKETARDYLICVQNLYSRLRHLPPEHKQVKRATEGLLTTYWDHCLLDAFDPYHSLLMKAAQIEVRWKAARDHRHPPPKGEENTKECSYSTGIRPLRDHRGAIHTVATTAEHSN